MLIQSDYKPPFMLFNGHLETIVPAIFRKVHNVQYVYHQIPTPDGDLLDIALETSHKDSQKLVIVSHGLEGSMERPYIKGMVKRFVQGGWHALAWNYRSCGGTPNRLPRFYHSGATDDLQLMIDYALSLKKYTQIVLIGFSLGGNLTLKYVGEQGSNASPYLKGAVAFSAPLHLSSCSKRISSASNWVYAQKFKRSLAGKVRQKAQRMPDALDTSKLAYIRTLKDFDDFYTAPLHGFASAEDYYEKCSSLYFLEAIALPTLIVNAWNDPLLSPACFPTKDMEKHSFVHLETPRAGGHCGFARSKNGFYWSENRAFEWIEGILSV
ncbi:MAG: alpha/beta fold hydrolase [Bacteroidetes bacterium]|nr:MAG: alpha/beta fold hydrolase [Bacteroidota bacterium]